MKNSLKFFGLMIVNMLGTSMYSTVAPYFPDEASKKGISTPIIGVILSGYPITALASSLIIGKYLGVFGKERILLLGCFLESLSVLGFSILPSVPHTMLILLGLIFRYIQGLGAG